MSNELSVSFFNGSTNSISPINVFSESSFLKLAKHFSLPPPPWQANKAIFLLFIVLISKKVLNGAA
ncbi:hypothetical protein [Paraclostridium bifermentans]|uniref:hypothetical protein n=1 Tax=Paraclostridium bifermentans TaxID=1490 RepID=UPI002FCD6A59